MLLKTFIKKTNWTVCKNWLRWLLKLIISIMIIIIKRAFKKNGLFIS